ncbi:MAG: hypothetical protein J6V76_07115 [Bacteroidales bacterium]|nr:hypothetical protein [Bacteroidales bacterium]MBO7142860.1 hypothetical protein [Bacteroidales bacterium]
MKLKSVLAIACVSMLCAGCATEKIANINSQPYRYNESAVQIKGRVVNTTNLFVLKTFKVADKSGEITVVADERRNVLPPVGTKVKVRGKVYEAFKLGSLQKIVVIEGVAPLVK